MKFISSSIPAGTPRKVAVGVLIFVLLAIAIYLQDATYKILTLRPVTMQVMDGGAEYIDLCGQENPPKPCKFSKIDTLNSEYKNVDFKGWFWSIFKSNSGTIHKEFKVYAGKEPAMAWVYGVRLTYWSMYPNITGSPVPLEGAWYQGKMVTIVVIKLLLTVFNILGFIQLLKWAGIKRWNKTGAIISGLLFIFIAPVTMFFVVKGFLGKS